MYESVPLLYVPHEMARKCIYVSCIRMFFECSLVLLTLFYTFVSWLFGLNFANK